MYFIWPLALVVAAEVLYQICAKSLPAELNPFASITVTYLIAAVVSAVIFFVTTKGGNIFHEYSKLNWAPFLLGIVVPCLEIGSIYAYKHGWLVNTFFVVHSAFASILLLLAGYMLYAEGISRNKIIGIAICIIGLVFINR